MRWLDGRGEISEEKRSEERNERKKTKRKGVTSKTPYNALMGLEHNIQQKTQTSRDSRTAKKVLGELGVNMNLAHLKGVSISDKKKIQQVAEFTKASAEQAWFELQSKNGDVQAAISSLLDNPFTVVKSKQQKQKQKEKTHTKAETRDRRDGSKPFVKRGGDHPGGKPFRGGTKGSFRGGNAQEGGRQQYRGREDRTEANGSNGFHQQQRGSGGPRAAKPLTQEQRVVTIERKPQQQQQQAAAPREVSLNAAPAAAVPGPNVTSSSWANIAKTRKAEQQQPQAQTVVSSDPSAAISSSGSAAAPSVPVVAEKQQQVAEPGPGSGTGPKQQSRRTNKPAVQAQPEVPPAQQAQGWGNKGIAKPASNPAMMMEPTAVMNNAGSTQQQQQQQPLANSVPMMPPQKQKLNETSSKKQQATMATATTQVMMPASLGGGIVGRNDSSSTPGLMQFGQFGGFVPQSATSTAFGNTEDFGADFGFGAQIDAVGRTAKVEAAGQMPPPVSANSRETESQTSYYGQQRSQQERLVPPGMMQSQGLKSKPTNTVTPQAQFAGHMPAYPPGMQYNMYHPSSQFAAPYYYMHSPYNPYPAGAAAFPGQPGSVSGTNSAAYQPGTQQRNNMWEAGKGNNNF